jgi:hypothetical protein
MVMKKSVDRNSKTKDHLVPQIAGNRSAFIKSGKEEKEKKKV